MQIDHVGGLTMLMAQVSIESQNIVKVCNVSRLVFTHPTKTCILPVSLTPGGMPTCVFRLLQSALKGGDNRCDADLKNT